MCQINRIRMTINWYSYKYLHFIWESLSSRSTPALFNAPIEYGYPMDVLHQPRILCLYVYIVREFTKLHTMLASLLGLGLGKCFIPNSTHLNIIQNQFKNILPRMLKWLPNMGAGVRFVCLYSFCLLVYKTVVSKRIISPLYTVICFCFRDVEKQEALWKYSLECLKDYISDEIVKELEGEKKPIYENL